MQVKNPALDFLRVTTDYLTANRMPLDYTVVIPQPKFALLKQQIGQLSDRSKPAELRITDIYLGLNIEIMKFSYGGYRFTIYDKDPTSKLLEVNRFKYNLLKILNRIRKIFCA